MRELLVRNLELGVRRKKQGTPNYELSALCLLLMLFLSGCVSVAGTAGYAKTNPNGEATVKQAGFDTADYIPSNSAPGKITV